MENRNIEEFMSKYISNSTEECLSEEKEFEKYCKLFKERFGRNAYISEPNGTRKSTIEAIKVCLEKNEDLLDQLLYPNLIKDLDNGVLY